MSDLISRQDAVNCVKWGEGVTDVIGRINALPSADRPELVYCKDCRHKFTCGMRVQYVKREQSSITVGSYMVDYCSHGERKEQSDE